MKIYHTKINDIFTNDANDTFYKMTSEGCFEEISDDDFFTSKTKPYELKDRTFTITELFELIQDNFKVAAIITIKDDFTNFFLYENFGFVMQYLRAQYGIKHVNIIIESTNDVSTYGF